MARADSSQDLLAALRLLHASGIGPVTFRKLVRVFGSPEAALHAPPERLREIPDLPRDAAARIREAAGDDWAQREIERARERHIRLLGLDDPAYPKALLRTYDPPPVLYVEGELQAADALAVAIVGTRRCSRYGREQAERLAGGLARAGFTVVSGLARGIDAAAHRGALDVPEGRTLAVLGNGLGQVYPAENRKLYEQIAAGRGAALSELPLDTPPAAEHFPRRNRIIAGAALGVLVVEGPEHSGALITARYAVDMDREIFAVPGPANSPNARGPHRLIKKGAKLVEDVEDILEELRAIAEPLVKLPPPDERLRLAKPKSGPQEQASSAPLFETSEAKKSAAAGPDARLELSELRALNLNPREAKLYALLDPHEEQGIERLIQASGLLAHEVLATLLVLEVRRLCRQLPGKRFLKA